MTLRTLIADDEPLARQRLKHLLQAESDVEIIAEAGSGSEALELLAEEPIDLLFLDIQMPEVDGFGVLEKLTAESRPVVIFTTAWSEHALRAFDEAALDYLLKPFKPARLQAAVARARQLIQQRHLGAAAQNLLQLLQPGAAPTPPASNPAAIVSASPSGFLSRLTIKTGDKVIFIRAEDIECLEAAGNYVVVHSAGESHIVREALSHLEAQLDPTQFLRISRSALVNLNHVKELQPLFKGDHCVVMTDGKKLTMTRGLREVEKALKFPGT